MSKWTTCAELIQELEDEDMGLLLLRGSLKGYPPDTRVKFFMDDKLCGVEFEDGKKLIGRLYPDVFDCDCDEEVIEDDQSKLQAPLLAKPAIYKKESRKARSARKKARLARKKKSR